MTNQSAQSNSYSIWPVYRTLVGIGMLCALLIVSVFIATAPAIEQNRADALQRAIFDVLPGTKHTQTYVYDGANGGSIAALEAGVAGNLDRLIYAGFDAQNHLVGVALQAKGQGYQDVITILYGYAPQHQAIIGMRVLESRETPGLGDKIEKDPTFISNFKQLDVSLVSDNLTLKHTIEAVKSGNKVSPWQVDGITGATISSVAIAQMLDASARLWAPRIQAHQNNLKIIKRGSHGS